MKQKNKFEDTPEGKWSKEVTGEIGKNIQFFRELEGISAEKLSNRTEKLGYKVPRNSIANIENNRKVTITLQELIIIARALNISPKILVANPLGSMKDFRPSPKENTTSIDAFELLNDIQGPEIFMEAYSCLSSYKSALWRLVVSYHRLAQFQDLYEKLMAGIPVFDPLYKDRELDSETLRFEIRRASITVASHVSEIKHSVNVFKKLKSDPRLSRYEDSFKPSSFNDFFHGRIEESMTANVPESILNWTGETKIPAPLKNVVSERPS